MIAMSRREYLLAIYDRYQRSSSNRKTQILDEFCRICTYNRKYAIRLLSHPPPAQNRHGIRRKRSPSYGPDVIQALVAVWRAAGFPWSVRLKALLPLWLPWIRKHHITSRAAEAQLLRISPRQMDRRLQPYKNELRHRIYGRTKPGTLLKHQIPIKTDHWDVSSPGFTEIDLVSHSGNCAAGEFAHSLNLTDIYSTWTEAFAVLGKGEAGVVAAIEEIRQALPFPLQGIDSDNGSEFINDHLLCYCRGRKLQFTRGRPYKKDDNAHIEQKNWTHVRRILGWDRYDTAAVVKLLNDLYRNELRLMMNLFQPSVKLLRKKRVGSRLRRIYDTPLTPLDRLRSCPEADQDKVADLLRLRQTIDPFRLAATIDRKLDRISSLATPVRRFDPESRVEPKRARRRA